MDDSEIVKLFFSRDEIAIAYAKNKYEKYTAVVCNNILNNELDAEECVNDTFYTLWNKIPPENPKDLKLYIAKIARNISLSKYRDKNRQKRVPDNICDPIDDFEEHLFIFSDSEKETDIKELSRLINKFMEQIHKKDRIIFVKRYYFNMKIEKIAEEVNLSTRSVLASLSKTRKELYEVLSKEDYV